MTGQPDYVCPDGCSENRVVWQKGGYSPVEGGSRRHSSKAGINSVVGHGHGTAWGWLHINIGSSEQFPGHTHDADGSHRNCAPCQKMHSIADKALTIAMQVTGRHGEYDGCINVYTQKEWSKKTQYFSRNNSACLIPCSYSST